ncbi:hypothetical protein ONE63_005689 [Megalurothrips usitatus]|uniref:Fibronectin type-III domain-containing protein n=1 Tax=Megalurothrips usitatus TaxID=439358 RepID=A0AAV7XWC9_9NEOP|nr:hypothetical protein ONE63_005689 [Megalurothrips usitatus]
MLSWRAPRHPNGVLRKYKIYMRSLDGMGLAKDEFEVPPTQSHYRITHLRLHHRYEFWAAAMTAAGLGASSRRVVQAPAQTAPARGGDRLQVTPDGELRLVAIQPTDAGNYTCAVENSGGKDAITYHVSVDENRNKGVPTTPLGLRVATATVSSLTLQWRPGTGHASPTGYFLHFKREFGEWEKTKLPADQVTSKNASDNSPYCSHTLVGLLCGTKYQMYVSAFNQLGTGLPTVILHARTQGSPPVAPDARDLLRVNSTSIALRLGAWQDAGCPISSLVLEYKLRHEHAWTLVSNNVQVDRQEYSVLDLSPATGYTLRMTAHNSAGSTVVSYEFLTLTNTGAALPAEPGGRAGGGSPALGVAGMASLVAGAGAVLLAGVGVLGFMLRRRHRSRHPGDDKTRGTDSPFFSPGEEGREGGGDGRVPWSMSSATARSIDGRTGHGVSPPGVAAG